MIDLFLPLDGLDESRRRLSLAVLLTRVHHLNYLEKVDEKIVDYFIFDFSTE